MSTAAQAAPERTPLPTLDAFTHVRAEILRLSDLDFQKHVNNAATTSLFANARFDYLGDVVRPHLTPDAKLVIARLEVDFTGEIVYGAPVHTGTRILGFGRTSMRLEQALFQNGRCAARAVSVFVHKAAGAAAPWPQAVLPLAVA